MSVSLHRNSGKNAQKNVSIFLSDYVRPDSLQIHTHGNRIMPDDPYPDEMVISWGIGILK